MEYLDKIYSLCKDNGINLVLMKAPSVYPHWYDEWDKQVSDYAYEHGILYLNTINEAGNIGIDYTTDTFDYGQHLNVEGAEKLSLYLGEQLVKNFRLTDHRQDESYKNAWQSIVNKYYEEKQEIDYEKEEFNVSGSTCSRGVMMASMWKCINTAR